MRSCNMKTITRPTKETLSKFAPLFLLAVFMLWMKTYVTQKTQFKLEVGGALQSPPGIRAVVGVLRNASHRPRVQRLE